MASRSNSLMIISYFIFILLSFSSSSGRFLDDHQPHPGHDDSAGSLPPSFFDTVVDRDHGVFKGCLIKSTARLFHFETHNLKEEDEGAALILNVDDFGAKGNGKDDTKAFKNAWEKACSSKRRTVLVVPKKKYLLKPIKLEGPCKSKNLTIRIEGTIEASKKRSDYNEYGRHWLLLDSVRDLSFEGGGTLDGNGGVWWKHSCKINKSLPCKNKAPTALAFHKCENLVVRDLKVRDAQQIQVSFQRCKKVKASNLTVIAPRHSPNTDGIHITHAQDIEISNSVIGTGDDCISIVSGSRKVRVTNIKCGPGHGISVGSLGIGNSEAYVSDIIVDRIKLFETTNGVRIKTWQGGSGSAKNIEFLNIEMNNVHNPIIIDQHYCDHTYPCKEESSAVQVKDILYQNITGTSATKVAIKFNCSKNFKCEGIVLKDVDIRQHGEKNKAQAFCENVKLTDIGFVAPLCPNAHTGRNNTTPSVQQPNRKHIIRNPIN